MGLNLTEAGIGTLLLAALVVMIWKSKKKGKRSHAWWGLAAGLFSTTTVVNILSLFLRPGFMIAGASFMLVVGVLAGIVFWHEGIKDNGAHHIRTPAVGFALGVAVVSLFGGVQSAVNNTSTQLTSHVAQFTHTGGK